MKLFFKLLAIFIIVTVLTALYISYSYNRYINSAPDDKDVKKIVVIRAGESIPNIINALEDNGVIVDGNKFYYIAKLTNKIQNIKYGEYEFSTSMRPLEILDKLVRGDIKKYKITIPEGFNLYQIAEVVAEQLLINKDDFIIKCMNKYFISSTGIEALTLEGYLFPDTYYFTKSMTLEKIVMKMVWNYRLNFNVKMKARAQELGMTEQEVVTLASIIEKETSKVEEMPLISAVFHNRLKINMRLQSDPTVIYGIPGFNGNITKLDLKTPTAYNTYTIYGLPPTPIANPGRDALKAALYPADVDYLFFVSKNNGTHHFSKTFEEHNGAVNQYQKKRRQSEKIP